MAIWVTPAGSWTKPLAIVAATAVPQKAPIRLVQAASIIAWRGVKTRVETTVAMALAASWKPLIYSKTTATKITTSIKTKGSIYEQSADLGVLQGNLEDDLAGIATVVDRALEEFVDIFQNHDFFGVDVALVEIAQEADHQAVGVAFDGL